MVLRFAELGRSSFFRFGRRDDPAGEGWIRLAYVLNRNLWSVSSEIVLEVEGRSLARGDELDGVMQRPSPRASRSASYRPWQGVALMRGRPLSGQVLPA